MRARRDEEPFGVFEQNWLVFELWCLVWRQWRWVAGGMNAVRVGLDWCQVEAVMRMQGIKRRRRPDLMRGLRVMEDAALAELEVLDQSSE